MAAFLKALTREDVAPVTVRGYRSDLGLFAAWYDGHPLEKLTASDLAHFRQYLSRERSMKPASINRKLEALRRFCRWAHTSGRRRTNVAAELRLARTPRGTRPKGLVAPEVQALLRAAGQSRRALAGRNYAVVQLLLQAGLRVSEAAALHLGDLEIHERQGRVHIRGKGDKERYVPLNATARRALHAYLDARKEAGTQDPVFLSETGTALSVRSIQSLITELARRAHLSRIPVSAHTLRHTFALGYLKQNPGKLLELATLLGHESLDTTAIYGLPSEEDLAAEVQRVLTTSMPERQRQRGLSLPEDPSEEELAATGRYPRPTARKCSGAAATTTAGVLRSSCACSVSTGAFLIDTRMCQFAS